jgi:hypothetical protein
MNTISSFLKTTSKATEQYNVTTIADGEDKKRKVMIEYKLISLNILSKSLL